MNKWLHALIVAVQLALVSSAGVLEHLSQTKMGVMRHILYTNAKWERLLPMDMVLSSAAGILLILATLLMIQWISRRVGMIRKGSAKVLVAISLAVLTSAFILLYSTVTFRAYYALCAAFSLTTLLQFGVGWTALSKSTQ